MLKETSCARGRHNMPSPCKLTFDLLTLKVVSDSRVTWATSVPNLVFLGLSVLDFGPMYATDRHRRALCPYPRGGGIMRMLSVPAGLESSVLIINRH